MTDTTLSRRTCLKALAVGASSGLAGCGGQGTGSGNTDTDEGGQGNGGEAELGERVPDAIIGYWSDQGATTRSKEQAVQITSEGVEEIGISVQPNGRPLGTQAGDTIGDNREDHFAFWMHFMNLTRLAPITMSNYAHITWAGSNTQPNPSQWANCEVSREIDQLRRAVADEDQRRHTNNIMRMYSEEAAILPVMTPARFGAYNTNQIEPGGFGRIGLASESYMPLLKSSALDGNDIVANANPDAMEAEIYHGVTTQTPLDFRSKIAHAPLLIWNENFELQNWLAESHEIIDDGNTISFTLLEGATFHNGDPITSEDVRYTFDFAQRHNDEITLAGRLSFESIEVIDDRTVEFQFDSPTPGFLTEQAQRWGIVPKDVWEASNADENPTNPGFDEIIGSGPYQYLDFEPGQTMQFEPHDGFPRLTPESNLTLISYADLETAFRSFEEGSLNMIFGISADTREIVQENVEFGEVVATENFLNANYFPQMNYGPTKFRPFRLAFSYAIDREGIHQTAFFGESEVPTRGTMFASAHPFYPGDDELPPISERTANPERAREILSDAGWGWDDDGNLRYPPDADLTPLWPEGDEPLDHPDQFECIDEDGYISYYDM